MVKVQLPIAFDEVQPREVRRSRFRAAVVSALVLVSGATYCFAPDAAQDALSMLPGLGSPDSQTAQCVQAEPLVPKHSLRAELDDLYTSSGFLEQSVAWLSGAVKIPTESFDDNGPPEKDPRWKPFHDLHAYLETAFPLVHSKFTLTKVNTLALVYNLVGSDPSLKPIFLAGHQDVVPVNKDTYDQWLQPPFSGFYDGEWIWGRGSGDDKSGLIGILISLETLLARGFVPKRSIVLGFGFDEETGGKAGALAISEYLLKNYGENSFSIIVDEGGGFAEEAGIVVAEPGVAEKGLLDVRLQVNTLGGHSSVPPVHTGIGILSSLIVQLEEHPTEAKITRDSTTYEALQCLVAHAPDISKTLRKNVKKARKSDKALRRVEEEYLTSPFIRALTQTTQAVDLISGGVKINALPEQVYAVVNHRIATHSSVAALQKRVAHLAGPIAHKFNMSLNAFGHDIALCSCCAKNKATAGSIIISEAFNSALDPAPRTPTGPDALPYKLLGGTIRAAYKVQSGGGNIVVVPGMSTGNTDTKRYWKLTPHIFRYNHITITDAFNGVHTVNEAVRATAIPNGVRFFTYLILNLDESESIA